MRCGPATAPALPAKDVLLARARPARRKWDDAFRPPQGVEPAGEGRESVWDYPRPPILAPAPGPIRVEADGHVVASSTGALEAKERASAPVPYLPPADVRAEWLVANGRVSICEWKGAAVSFDLTVPGGPTIPDAAWCYPDPFDDLAEGYAAIAGRFAFYPAKLACFVGDERVQPQPGGFYGGWMTRRIAGPVKGAPGTGHW